MKKILIILFASLVLPAFADSENLIQGGVNFDWLTKSQIERDVEIARYKNIIFDNENVEYKYKKSEFRDKFSEFLKDPNYLKNYTDAKNYVRERKDCKIAGFFTKHGNLMVAYAIQYKDKQNTVYYYDTLGNLKYIDMLSTDYPNFPYYSLQYKINGELVSAIYVMAGDDQFMYSLNGEFKGRWYGKNYYNRNGKVKMTRTNTYD